MYERHGVRQIPAISHKELMDARWCSALGGRWLSVLVGFVFFVCKGRLLVLESLLWIFLRCRDCPKDPKSSGGLVAAIPKRSQEFLIPWSIVVSFAFSWFFSSSLGHESGVSKGSDVYLR